MTTMRKKHVTLLLCDDNFKETVLNYEVCKEKLFKFINNKESSKNVEIKTVTGRYSFGENLPVFNTESRNKTLFVKSIGDYLNKFDDVVIITNTPQDPYVISLIEFLGSEEVPTTQFTYKTKEYAKSKT